MWGLNIGDSSLFLLDSAIEDNNYVIFIYILGGLAKLFELQFLPSFLKREEKHILCSTGMRVKW